MSQRYKVYFANRPVILSDEAPAPGELTRFTEVFPSRGKLDTMYIEQAIGRGARQVYIICDDPDKSWQQFREQFEFVQAAGGIVRRRQGDVLFIYRNEKWDLPKGKVEPGETNEVAALREVAEECSLLSTRLEGHVCDTWHTYIQNGIPVLKCTVWFAMVLEGNEQPKPQEVEGITETRWLLPEELGLVQSNTYPSILDVLSAYYSRAEQPAGGL